LSADSVLRAGVRSQKAEGRRQWSAFCLLLSAFW
jgi:hypothetical protein